MPKTHYRLADASIAAGLLAASVNTLLKRGQIQLGDDVRDGRARLFSVDDIVQLALMEKLIRFGVERDKAWSLVSAFTNAGDWPESAGGGRQPGQLFPKGSTLLVIEEDAGSSRIINVSRQATFAEIVGDGSAAFVIDVGAIVERVRANLKTIDDLDA